MKLKRLLIAGAAVVLVLFCYFLLRGPEGRLKLPAGPHAPLVSLGDSHGLILAPDGSIWSWGEEDRGFPVLGLGKMNHTANLVRVGLQTNWLFVSAGDAHNLALKSDGTIWAWGADFRGQLGDGKYGGKLSNGTLNMEHRPVQTVEGTDWVRVVAGFTTGYALKRVRTKSRGRYGCTHQICSWLLGRCHRVLDCNRVLGQTDEDAAAITAQVVVPRAHRRSGRYKALHVDGSGQGWRVGSEAFRQELLAQVTELATPKDRGEEVRQSALAKAERIAQEELNAQGWSAQELQGRPKGDPQEVRIAARLRRNQSVEPSSAGCVDRDRVVGSADGDAAGHGRPGDR